jgi:mRNA interferase MazF
MTLTLKKGEIWLANLNPNKGTEPGKTRPVLIMQDQALLDVAHPSTIIIPLTTNLVEDAAPLRIRIKAQGGLKKNSDLLIDQIRAIDNHRLTQKVHTTIGDVKLNEVYDAVCEVMGINFSL